MELGELSEEGDAPTAQAADARNRVTAERVHPSKVSEVSEGEQEEDGHVEADEQKEEPAAGHDQTDEQDEGRPHTHTRDQANQRIHSSCLDRATSCSE